MKNMLLELENLKKDFKLSDEEFMNQLKEYIRFKKSIKF